MITLVIDTAYKYLVLGIYRDGKLVDGFCAREFKRQSETVFVELEALLQRTGLDYRDIDEIIVTDGPGSYTGIRIGMTIAKVLGTSMHKAVKTLSTMQMYAGKAEKANVILDARGKRAYAAYLEDGKLMAPEEIVEVENLPAWIGQHPGLVLGDTELIGQESADPDFLKNFADLLDEALPVENIHALVPRYLKESSAYKA